MVVKAVPHLSRRVLPHLSSTDLHRFAVSVSVVHSAEFWGFYMQRVAFSGVRLRLYLLLCFSWLFRPHGLDENRRLPLDRGKISSPVLRKLDHLGRSCIIYIVVCRTAYAARRIEQNASNLEVMFSEI